MPTEVVLPRLGLTQEEGTVVRWLKVEGSRVAKGEPLFEVMTDKATLEVEAPASGVLLRILVAEGGTVPVATPIAVIGEPDEAALHSALGAPGTGGRAHTAGGQAEAGRSGGAAANADRKADQRPIEAGSRAEVGAEWSQDTAAGNGPGRNVSAASPAPDPTGRVKISPRARALADAQGVDVRSLAGTGPGGRVIERDVQQAIAARAAAPAGGAQRPAAQGAQAAGSPGPQAAAPAPTTVPSPPVRQVPQAAPGPGPAVAPSAAAAKMRAIIARRMLESLQTTAQLTLTTEADMDEIERLRSEVGPELERREGVAVTYTDLIVRAVAVALREHPAVNARWEGEGVRRLPEIHIGVAVALDEGLVVPVVRNADRATLAQLSAAIRDLSERARAMRLRPEEMQGGTFTVTNLGMYDVDAFTPVLNPPEAGILGVGRLHRRPAAVGDRVEIRSGMVLSLTFDHRVVDGAPAAQFLQRTKFILEHPYLLLLP